MFDAETLSEKWSIGQEVSGQILRTIFQCTLDITLRYKTKPESGLLIFQHSELFSRCTLSMLKLLLIRVVEMNVVFGIIWVNVTVKKEQYLMVYPCIKSWGCNYLIPALLFCTMFCQINIVHGIVCSLLLPSEVKKCFWVLVGKKIHLINWF